MEKIFYYFLFYFIMIIYIMIVTINKYYKFSFVKCIGSNHNRTCLYKNIYFFKGKWIIHSKKYTSIDCVSVRSRNSNICWKPLVLNKKFKYDEIITGLTTYMELFFTQNIGHLLWDDLYSMYLSFLKFNFTMNRINIIISKNNDLWRNNKYTQIFEVFSINKLLYENDMLNKCYLIKNLVVGLGHHCQRCVNSDYTIPGGNDYFATWWMRKRMYYTYNITRCKYKKQGIIIQNKRYNEKEIDILKKLSSYFKYRINITYIDWRNVKEFKEQLDILSCTSVYISGPGTGLLNFPFMSDPGVIINLGGLYRGCPFYMEQYIEEGSLHFISLYYPSSKRKYGINKEEMILLINQAIKILNNWKKFKLNHKSNLNIEALIFKNISLHYPNLMGKFLKETDWGKGKGYGVWAEKLLYFPRCYKQDYMINIIKNETKNNDHLLGCKINESIATCE